MELTISGKDKKLLKQVEDLARRLGLRIKKHEIDKTKAKQAKAIEALENLARIGAFQDIQDSVAWQHEQRKYRDIGRDE